MSMKNKLRRAFKQSQPDVLERILDDCPAPGTAVTGKPGRKMSDRAKEFIATAAALALIISAVGGGFVYYRDYFSRNDSGSVSPSGSPDTLPMPDPSEPANSGPALQYPTMDTAATDPDWTEGPDLTEPGPDGRTISWLTARDIALELWGVALNDVRILKFGDEGDTYHIYFEYAEYAYGVYISALDGSVIYDEGCYCVGPHSDGQSEQLMGWADARDLCLNACGYGLDEMIGFTWEYHSGTPAVYYMELYFPDAGFSYTVNAQDGTFVNDPVVEPTPPDGNIGADIATLLAVQKAGLTEDYAAGAVTELAWKYDDRDPANRCYWIYFRARGANYEVCVHAYSGEVLSLQAYAAENFYSPEDAIQRALDYSHVSQDQYVHIECILLDTGTNRSVYLVIFDQCVYTMVDANTLRIMDVDNPFPTDTIGKSAAAVKALNLIGVDSWDRCALVMEGVFNDGYPFYCVEFYGDDLRYLCIVDAYSGEILSKDLSEPVLGAYTDLSLYAALKHLNLTTEDVTDLAYEYDMTTDPEAPRNRIFFTVENLRYEVVVSACYPSHLEILEVHTTYRE